MLIKFNSKFSKFNIEFNIISLSKKSNLFAIKSIKILSISIKDFIEFIAFKLSLILLLIKFINISKTFLFTFESFLNKNSKLFIIFLLYKLITLLLK